MDPELDRNISDHVLRMHRYRSPTEQDGDGEQIKIYMPVPNISTNQQSIESREKPVIGASSQVGHKPCYTTAEDAKRL